MAQININTSQNVEIEYSVCDLGRRILAQILDIIIIISYIIVVMVILEKLSIRTNYIMILFFLPAIFYSFITESMFNGQSFAKMIVGIKVVKLDGSQAKMLNYFIRWMFRIIDIVISSGVIAIVSSAVSQKGQRLGDRAAGVILVNIRKKQSLEYSIFQALPDDYELKFPQANNLLESEIQTISIVLKMHDQNKNSKSTELLSKTKNAIERKIGVNSSLSDLVFLRTIITDYNYIVRNDEF